MATIANLAAKVSCDGSGFEKTFNSIDARIKKTEKSAGTMGKVFSGLKVAAVALAAIAIGSYVKDTIKGIVDDLQIARRLGEDVSALQEMRSALISVGQPAEIAAQTLSKLNKSLANASVGLDPALADTLSRMGLKATDLARAKPYEALRKIAIEIGKIPDPMKRAALATQIFGDDAAALLPLLSQGSKAFDDAAANVAKFGGGVDNIEATKLQAMVIQADKMQEAFKLMVTRIMVDLVPFMQVLVEELTNAADTGLSFADIAKTVGATIGLFVLIIVEVFRSVKLVVQFVKLGILGIAKVAIYALKQVMELGAKLPAKLGGNEFRKAAQTFQEWGDTIGGEMDSTTTDIDNNIDKIGTSISKFPDMVLKAMTGVKAAPDVDLAKKLTGGGSVPMADKFAELFGKGKDITKEFQSPLEKFKSKVDEMNALINAGAISWDTYAKATNAAVSELEKAHELTNFSAPKAILKNTAESASATTQQGMRDARYRETPDQRLERVMNESKDIEKKQLEQMKKVAVAVQNPKIVKF